MKNLVSKSIATLISGCACYLAMAACSAAGQALEEQEAAKPDGGAPSSVTDPVARARAETTAPSPSGLTTSIETAVEKCDVVYNGTAYAEHAYPGVSAAELSQVTVLFTYNRDDLNKNIPSGYTASMPVSYVKDGYAAVFCGTGVSQMTFVRRVLSSTHN